RQNAPTMRNALPVALDHLDAVLATQLGGDDRGDRAWLGEARGQFDGELLEVWSDSWQFRPRSRTGCSPTRRHGCGESSRPGAARPTAPGGWAGASRPRAG